MKKIKKFESFINNLQTNYYVVNSVNYYDEYGTSELELPLIVSIVLEDGSILIAEEDTGGELAFFQIDSQDVLLKKGDVIKFDTNINEHGEIWDIQKIYINDIEYPANVGSEGGNRSTYLFLQK